MRISDLRRAEEWIPTSEAFRDSAAFAASDLGCYARAAVNIHMSLSGAQYFREIKEHFGPSADIAFGEDGYLILGSPDVAEARRAATGEVPQVS